MLRRIASACLVVFLFAGTGLAEGVKHFDPKDLKTRNLLLEAFQSVSPFQRAAKLRELLKISPDNYFALVKLGELEINKGEEYQLKAIEYFLRAALSQPQRPEAYLALAQTYFQMGYVPEGTDFMMKALMGPRAKLTYEAVCLEGQKYLDTANYFGAIVTYADAALSRSSPWKSDSYLLAKLYEATTMSDAPSFWVWKDSGLAAEGVGNVYWVQYVFAKMVSMATSINEDRAYREVIMALRKHAEKLREIRPSLTARAAEKLINVHLYRAIMAWLRSTISDSAENERYHLPKRFFDFGVCGKEDARVLDENLNLYEVFVGASVTDPQERKALLAKLEKIRNEAVKAVSGIEDPKKRGEALFKWLRENLIVKYDAVDGITAEGVVNKKKYLCLSGAILYTLIGRDAGLDVNGFIVPNHAFSVMYDKDGNRINVETTAPVKETATSPAGFDLPPENVVARGTDVRGQAMFEGETKPLDLVSYQYINVGINKLDDLMINKYREELVNVLKEEDLEPAKIEALIKRWRYAGAQGEKYAAMAKMAEKYPKFHEEMSQAIDEALDTVSQARAFNPFNVEFLRAIEQLAQGFSILAMASPASSMQKRLRQIREDRRRSMREEVEADMRQDAESQTGPKDDKKKTDKKAEGESEEKEAKKKKKKKKSKFKTAEEEETGETAFQEDAPEIRSYEKEQDRAVAAAKTEYEATPEEISKEWPRERQFWLTSLRRLEKLVEKHPCSDQLLTILLDYSMNVADVLAEAKKVNSELEEGERLDYDEIIDELSRVRIEFFDTRPAMAERLSAKLGKLL